MSGQAMLADQVEVLAALTQLQKLVGERCQDLILDGLTNEDWAAMGDCLERGAKLCRRMVVLEPATGNDNGAQRDS